MSRRSLITALVVSILSLMTVAGLILAVLMGTGGLSFGGRIAVVEVNGLISGDQAFREDVRRLRQDPSVRGWVVAINSPGGVVAPSQSLYETLQRIRTEDGVPVVASIGAVGASGGYYVALAADSIMALPGSITGSIGVIMEYPEVSGLMDKVGVRMEIVKAGAQKDLGSPFRPMTERDRAILNAMLDDVHTQFIEAVAESRGLSVDSVRPLADGRVLSGRQALEQGLVDRLGNLDDAVSLAGQMAGLGPTPGTVRPPREGRSWLLNTLLGGVVSRLVQPLADAAPGSGAGMTVKYVVH